MYLDLKLTYLGQIYSSETDIKKKGEEELNFFGNDLKTVDNTIFNFEFYYNSFNTILKEKCQNSWDPLFEEYHRVKSLRYFIFKLSC